MPGCLVPGCTSSYKSNCEKVHFFSVPKDDELKKKWQVALKRPTALISKTQVVCDKHFLFGDIVRSRQLLSPDGKVLGVSPYQRPRLLPGAVPSVFAWTEVIPCSDNSKCSDEVIANVLDVDCIHESSSTPQELDCNASKGSMEVFNFEPLMTDSMQLPTSWIRNDITHKGETMISFSFLRCNMVNGQYYICILKDVIVDSKLQLYTHVLQKPVIDSSFMNVKKSIASLAELENYLSQIHKLQVCDGVVHPDICDKEKSDSFDADKRNVFRHQRCTLLCISPICNVCQNAQKALRKKRKRNEVGLQDSTSSNKKSRLTSNIVRSGKTHVTRLKRRLSRSVQQKKKLLLTNKKLRRDLKTSQKIMSIKSEGRILNELRSNDIAENQCTAVQEILKASHCKASSGRRYSENWLMLCMLLYLRSVSGYNFIRDNNFLPLPSVRTMRRNLATINTQCGFDSEFFKAFESFLSKKEEIYRHGVLLLDEMSCRESINVCSQNLTYVGLEDFAGESDKVITINDKANHGLVLMFQPLYDKYTQPVAVFGSHGPVSGQVLSQLIVKGILLLEKSGAKIHGVITDGAATNRKFLTILGMSGKKNNFKNYFEHPSEPDRKVFIFSDTPHFMKTIRNRLHKTGIFQTDPEKSPIEWQHLKDLYDKDSQLPGKLRMCPKINNEHLDSNSSSKMRVRLAVQIFSQSVANALKRYAANDPRLTSWESTAEFCIWMNQMFDALNRPESRGMLPNNEDFTIIEVSLQKLNDWEENLIKEKIPETAFLTTPTAEGLRVTLQSSLDIVRLLTEKYGFLRLQRVE